MTYLLDTNVVSELRRAKSVKADARVVAWAETAPVAGLFLSAITILELELGVLLIERRDPIQGAMLRGWFEQQVLATFSGRILAVDTLVARRCAKLHIPHPRSERDALIAATALTHNLVVATRKSPILHRPVLRFLTLGLLDRYLPNLRLVLSPDLTLYID